MHFIKKKWQNESNVLSVEAVWRDRTALWFNQNYRVNTVRHDVRSLTVPSARIAISFDYDAWVNRNYVSQFAAEMGDSLMERDRATTALGAE